MANRSNDKRNFALRSETGEETKVFSGKMPRQAALKAARRLEAADSEEESARSEFRLREKGTKKLHIYEGWAWREQAPEDKPDWMAETITQANVSKEGIEYLDEL
ncbi:non-histone chromosomal MC1 family protein (plasmid) [Halococcus dombrowskii]|jgi:hypothetical protein|uniref:Non-histone chromosomal MC1 family protein n=1 Tax=Halococcus dombrowskii TaxID=179637 RepID=A0AAX3ASR1_HALDO|nr:non-histone chromosomal MC1 family protein [Halococcus dombrowskii]UOO97173.1 non-histone chromosomal MC1 family protein [Halococcus dombrowskii]